MVSQVFKEFEEVGGSEIKYEREISKSPNPYRSYDIEFTEYRKRIGKGVDGAAFFCTNKFDLGNYVVKKIPVNRNSEGRVKREVQALAALQHRHVMQYFQAWEEDCVAVELNSTEEDDEEIDPPTKTCFIILETCPRNTGTILGTLHSFSYYFHCWNKLEAILTKMALEITE